MTKVMKKTIPLYILAQAQTCVPIPIPELNPCAQRILQTESSLFSSFNLLSTLSGLHGLFDRSQGPYSAKIGQVLIAVLNTASS